MGIKATKPKRKLFGKIKDLDSAVAKSKTTAADTKALSTAAKEFDATKKVLGKAVEKTFKSFDGACKTIPDPEKNPSPAGPVPIPYPTFSKLEKETRGAVQDAEKALKKHEKACKKLVKVIDKELKVLKASAASSKGDEAGTMKGLVSAKNTAKSHMTAFSSDVKAEGKAVTRFFDLAKKNY